MAVALAALPLEGPGAVVLAVGCDDAKVRLFTGSAAGDLVAVVELTGHADWVRTVCFARHLGGSDLLLASGSQDMYIRLWRISRRATAEDAAAAAAAAGTVALSFRERAAQRLRKTFVAEGCGLAEYEVKLEALLAGHEGWVYSVRWHPSLPGSCSLCACEHGVGGGIGAGGARVRGWR